MSNISLKSKSFKLLLDLINDPAFRKNIENKAVTIGLENIEAEFSESEIQSVIDILTFALTEVGLDKNSEPNDLGIKIEALIDSFSVHLYKH